MKVVRYNLTDNSYTVIQIDSLLDRSWFDILDFSYFENEIAIHLGRKRNNHSSTGYIADIPNMYSTIFINQENESLSKISYQSARKNMKYLGAIKIGYRYLLVHIIKKSSTLVFIEINKQGKIREFSLEVELDLKDSQIRKKNVRDPNKDQKLASQSNSSYSTDYLPKFGNYKYDNLYEVIKNEGFSIIHDEALSSIGSQSSRLKLYVHGESLFLVSDVVNNYTSIFTIDIDDLNIAKRIISKGAKAFGDIDSSTILSNSYLLQNKLFQASFSKEVFAYAITDITSDTNISGHLTIEDEQAWRKIEFKEAAGPTYHWDKLEYELPATIENKPKKMLKKMHGGEIAVSASIIDGIYHITTDSYYLQQMTIPGNNPAAMNSIHSDLPIPYHYSANSSYELVRMIGMAINQQGEITNKALKNQSPFRRIMEYDIIHGKRLREALAKPEGGIEKVYDVNFKLISNTNYKDLIIHGYFDVNSNEYRLVEFAK